MPREKTVGASLCEECEEVASEPQVRTLFYCY